MTALLSVVIPVRNEEHRLRGTLRGLVGALRPLGDEAEVLVVDNGSSDRSADVVRRHPACPVPIRLINCAQPGKGAAVRAGVLHTDSTYVGFCDADLATGMEALGPTLAQLRAGVNVVVGSRAHPSSIVRARHSVVRQGGAWVFRRLARHVVPGIADTQCGYKFFDRATAEAVFRPLRTTGFAFDVEVLARAQRMGAVIFELPVRWTDVAGSTFRPARDGYRSFASLARMRAILAQDRARTVPPVPFASVAEAA